MLMFNCVFKLKPLQLAPINRNRAPENMPLGAKNGSIFLSKTFAVDLVAQWLRHFKNCQLYRRVTRKHEYEPGERKDRSSNQAQSGDQRAL